MTEKRESWLSIMDDPDNREEIRKENRLAIRMLALAGLPLSVANVLAQTIINNRDLSLRSCWLVVYFALLLLVERKLLPQRTPRVTLTLYILEAPVMIMSILMGTVWDPTHQALTFLLFLMAMPVFVLDHPIRLFSVISGWSIAFLILVWTVKDPSTHRADLFHTLEFFLATTAVTMVVLRVRLESLHNLERTRYHLEHDELTSMRNRRALLRRVDRYLGKPVLIILCNLDQITLYNDFYGHETGDEMILLFSQVITDLFGEEDSYRYAGEEVLCVVIDPSEEECLARLELCRRKLHGNEFNGRKINLTTAFGYTMGTAADAKEFMDMVQLADINSHKAVAQGHDQTVGGPFSAHRLRLSILESNISTHARVHETNQLTGLPSMAYFISRADEMRSNENIEAGRTVVIGFINLMALREYNDEFGYAQGDALIRFTAQELKKCFPNRMLCCINGSQFGVLCYEDEVVKGIEQLNETLSDYRKDFPNLCKAGFAISTETDSTISLLDRARIAHDSIHDDPEQAVRFYDEKLSEEIEFRHYIINHVDEAVEKGWLQVYYQPIVRAITGVICNEEALSRWIDPNYGFLPPYRFIPLLEENRLIYKVSLHVVSQILKDFRKKEELGIPLVPVSVNLSRHDFQQCDMVQEISNLVDQAGYDRSLLKIEITESAFVEDQDLLKWEVQRFREQGFDVWMDDFGSEYSTLNLLQELSFDLIKIDMQFMRNFSSTGKNIIIVSDILDMARKMGITTLIEGVETTEHVRLLRELGCEKLQGFHFDRPQPLEVTLKRAQSEDGLRLENREETAYFQSLGQVDFRDPFSYGSQVCLLHSSNEVPAGILELKDGHFHSVLANERFCELMVEVGFLAVDDRGDSPELVNGGPKALHLAAQKCREKQEWVNFTVEDSKDKDTNCYIHYIAENPVTGASAYFTVMLRSNIV